ncbi:hypothetical protein B296_00038847 [Ensete ventricosum]|uniref:Uncharacterized protein n=1 Tax=Ensete ventricosum TaxID=4639 RepID=A0A426X536_ENSVE|nr:hypothetical protein B296_00038847 [Ensete ventricosum]
MSRAPRSALSLVTACHTTDTGLRTSATTLPDQHIRPPPVQPLLFPLHYRTQLAEPATTFFSLSNSSKSPPHPTACNSPFFFVTKGLILREVHHNNGDVVQPCRLHPAATDSQSPASFYEVVATDRLLKLRLLFHNRIEQRYHRLRIRRFRHRPSSVRLPNDSKSRASINRAVLSFLCYQTTAHPTSPPTSLPTASASSPTATLGAPSQSSVPFNHGSRAE